jgi:hypothetical protein
MVVTRELSFNLGGSVSSMGLPVNGTLVRLYDYWHQSGSLVKHFLCEQTTGNKGTFSFDVRKGIYCIEIVPSTNTRYARQSIEAIKVTSNTNFEITLKSGAILSGTVRDAGGQTVNNAEILVFGIEPHVIRVSQKLDQNGKYSLSLPHGRYYLALAHCSPQEGKPRKNPVPFLFPFFQVVELEKDSQHDISLPSLISFKGKVTNTEGHPMSAVKAIVKRTDRPENVFAREISMEVTAFTLKDGSFECLLQEGNYAVRLVPPEDSHLAEKTLPAILVDCDRKRNYSLEPGYNLTGRITHRGEPVPNATVNAIGVNLDSVALSDEDGNYQFSLPGGTYEIVTAAQPDSLGTVCAMELAPSKGTLILGEDTEHNIEMEPGVLVTGIVQDPSREPRAGVQMALYATINGEFNALASRRRALWLGITGDDGSYEFRLHPDRYWLVLNNQPSTGHLIDVSKAEQINNLTINDVCLVSFEVLSENDEPIPNCQVSFEAYNLMNDESPRVEEIEEIEEIAMPVFTSNNGRCTMTLPQGVYSFDFHPPEHSSYCSRLIRQLSVGADMVRRVRLLAREGQKKEDQMSS